MGLEYGRQGLTEVTPGMSAERLHEVAQGADDISGLLNGSMVFDTSPYMLKMRSLTPDPAREQARTAEELGAPETVVRDDSDEIPGGRAAVLQERVEKDPVEPARKLEMIADYMETALAEGVAPSAGIEDFVYSDGELLYVDVTDTDSLPEASEEAVETAFNGLATSASYRGIDHGTIDSILGESHPEEDYSPPESLKD